MTRGGCRRRRARAWGVVAVAVAVCWAAAPAGARPPTDRFGGAALDRPTALPDFALRDQGGRTVALSAQRGKLVLLTFLYTHCPDVCPLTAQNLDLAVRALGPDGAQVRVLAVSVDPAGDTRASVRKFVRDHRLSSRFRYLTGTRAQLAPVWRAYNVASVPHAMGDVDHTLYVVLADRAGMGRVVYDSTVHAATVEHDLRLLLR